jgi:hypothetical protein
VAGFGAPPSGWFCAPHDSLAAGQCFAEAVAVAVIDERRDAAVCRGVAHLDHAVVVVEDALQGAADRRIDDLGAVAVGIVQARYGVVVSDAGGGGIARGAGLLVVGVVGVGRRAVEVRLGEPTVATKPDRSR